MAERPRTMVATVPITVGGVELHVEIDVGVDTRDSDHLLEGRAGTDGDFLIFDGPPCRFTLEYRVLETGQRGRAGMRGICEPRGHVAIQIAPPGG